MNPNRGIFEIGDKVKVDGKSKVWEIADRQPNTTPVGYALWRTGKDGEVLEELVGEMLDGFVSEGRLRRA